MIQKKHAISVKKGEIIAVIGTSASVNSRFLEGMDGYWEPSENESSLEDSKKSFNLISQELPLHEALTVKQAFSFLVNLHSPKSTNTIKLDEIFNLLNEFELFQYLDWKIADLPTLARKLLFIVLGTLFHSSLLIFDKLVDDLDIEQTKIVHSHLRLLSSRGYHIILLTENIIDYTFIDKVAFLGPNLEFIWYGTPTEAINFFNQNLDQAGALRLDQSDLGRSTLQNLFNNKFNDVLTNLNESYTFQNNHSHQTFSTSAILVPGQPLKSRDNSSFQNLKILVQRDLLLLTKNPKRLFIILFSPIILVLVGLYNIYNLEKNPFDFWDGDPIIASTGIFMFVQALLISGIFAFTVFFGSDRRVQKYEYKLGLPLRFILMSKFTFIVILSAYQSLVFYLLYKYFVHIQWDRYEQAFIVILIFLTLVVAMTNGSIGTFLLDSKIKRLTFFVLLIGVNICASGIFIKIPKFLVNLSPPNLAFKGMIMTSGIGSDIASDSCWKFPEEIRSAMTLDDKDFFDCSCMGISVLNRDSCNFPGSGRFFIEEILTVKPLPPVPPAGPPEPPVLLSPPPPPDNMDDPKTKKEYQKSLENYDFETERRQRDFRIRQTSFNFRQEIYRSKLSDYEEQTNLWNSKRLEAVSLAERTIASLNEKIGWSFTDKKDYSIYITTLTVTTVILLIHGLISFLLFAFIVYRYNSKYP